MTTTTTQTHRTRLDLPGDTPPPADMPSVDLSAIDAGPARDGQEVAPTRHIAARISEALAQAAVAAANEKYVTGGRGGFAGRQDNRAFRRIIRAIVAVFFALPVAAMTVYLLFIASDQYQIESRFAVRAVSTPMGDIISSLGGSGAAATKSETAIVTKYLKSESLVRALDSDIGLADMYGSDAGDRFVRFDPSSPIEDLSDYWSWKIGVSEESATGLITMKVTAFTPEDALKISNAVIAHATTLVNSLSEQNRQSVLALAESRLERARARQEEVAVQMAGLRNTTGVIDGDAQSAVQLKLVSALELQLAKLEATRASLGSLSPDSIKLRAIDPQIRSLRAEIERQRARLTSAGVARRVQGNAVADASGNRADQALSGVMLDFERLQAEQTIARQEFANAAVSYEDARIGAERQQIYLSVFMPPGIPQSSVYPKRWLVWLITFAAAGFVTFVLTAIARSVRDNRAV